MTHGPVPAEDREQVQAQSHGLDRPAAALASPPDGFPTGPAAGQPAKLRLPFAARFQGLLIVVLLVGLVLIAQQASVTLYKIGLPLLVVSAFLQIAFGNIPPRARFGRSMAMLALTWAIVAALFYISVQLAPTLIDATRSTSGGG